MFSMSKTKHICKTCGREYSGDARFCAACGSRLVARKSANRKTVYFILGISLPVILAGMLLVGIFSNWDNIGQMVPGNTHMQTQNQTVPSVTEGAENTILDQFVFTSFVPNDTEYTDGFWAIATSGEKTVLVGLDKDLNYLCALDAEQYDIYDGPYEGYSYGMDLTSGRNVILDSEQKDVTARYAGTEENGSVLSFYYDDTGVTVWTCEIMGSGESAAFMVYAKDLQGNTKYAWNLPDMLETRDNLPPMPCGRSWYVFGHYVLDVATGQMLDMKQSQTLAEGEISVLGADKDDNVFIKSQTATETRLVMVIPWLGTGSCLFLKAEGQIGRYCNSVCYVHGVLAEDNEQIHGILDADGNYTPWPDADREYEFLPEFKNGYALVEFRNENGESVVTLLDKKGEMLFAPIPGEAIPSVVPGQEELTVFSCVNYPIMTDRGKESLNLDGTTTLLEEGSVFHTLSVTKCGSNYYRIEDGKVFADYKLEEALSMAN